LTSVNLILSYQQTCNKWFKVFAKISDMLIQFFHVFQTNITLTKHIVSVHSSTTSVDSKIIMILLYLQFNNHWLAHILRGTMTSYQQFWKITGLAKTDKTRDFRYCMSC